MKKICTLVLVIGTLLCSNVFAVTNVVERQTKGQGADRAAAIQKALAEAVAQVQGAIVSSGDYEFGYKSATTDVDYKKDDAGKKVAFDAVSVHAGGTVLKTEIGGLVKSYEVLEEKKLDDKTYEVTLKVLVYDYQSPQTKRVSMAVMPPQVLKDGYRFGAFTMPAEMMSAKVTQGLSAGLADSNKFAVLDREHIIEFAHNRNIMLSGDTSLEEMSKLGQVLGADYMVVGTVSDARLEVTNMFSQAIGKAIWEYKADFVFDFKVIEGPTRQIKFADTVNIRLAQLDQIKQLVSQWEPENLDFKELADNLIAAGVESAVKEIVERLYPVRIASIDENGQIIIGQGGKRVFAGQVMDVYTEGKEIIDPDTKESLGKTETVVATIRIDKVTEKISYATVIEGDVKKLSDGLVCRDKEVPQMPIAEKAKPQSNVKTMPSGGVKLPFDK